MTPDRRPEAATVDEIEAEYLREIDAAMRRGDNDAALELSTGLNEYRTHLKA